MPEATVCDCTVEVSRMWGKYILALEEQMPWLRPEAVQGHYAALKAEWWKQAAWGPCLDLIGPVEVDVTAELNELYESLDTEGRLVLAALEYSMMLHRAELSI